MTCKANANVVPNRGKGESRDETRRSRDRGIQTLQSLVNTSGTHPGRGYDSVRVSYEGDKESARIMIRADCGEEGSLPRHQFP